MPPTITVTDTPTPADVAVILDGLVAFNEATAGPGKIRPLIVVLLKDDQGATVGGLSGRTVYDWALVELIYVPEAMRRAGHGAALMSAAESEARRRGCIGLYLDTYSFQAREFYIRLGYREFGTLPYPSIQAHRHFLCKQW